MSIARSLSQDPIILDLGAQNINKAKSKEVFDLIKYYNSGIEYKGDVKKYCDYCEEGSSMLGDHAGYNGFWLGDLAKKLGIHYTALDMFDSPGVLFFDLNEDSLPSEMHGAADIVLNFGTTEHVINQLNCFKVAHNACRSGGVMLHSVPYKGPVEHGYFGYNLRFFKDLAEANSYQMKAEIGHCPIFQEVEDEVRKMSFASHDSIAITGGVPPIPFVLIDVEFKKINDEPFNAGYDGSTSVFSIYRNATRLPVEERLALASDIRKTHEGIALRDFEAAQVYEVYQRWMVARSQIRFPLMLQMLLRHKFLDKQSEFDLVFDTLPNTEARLRRHFPLLAYAEKLKIYDFNNYKIDLKEEWLSDNEDESEKLKNICSVYAIYYKFYILDLFPLDLELWALREIEVMESDNLLVKIRIGKVLASLTQNIQL